MASQTEEAAGEGVGEFLLGIVEICERDEAIEVLPVEAPHLLTREAVIELPRMRPSLNFPHQLLSLSKILLKSMRIVGQQIKPR